MALRACARAAAVEHGGGSTWFAAVLPFPNLHKVAWRDDEPAQLELFRNAMIVQCS
jgi:hypothetical protein